MNVLKFAGGWVAWHVRALFWYLTLGIRLYFAVGLDRDFNPDGEQNMGRHFRYGRKRTYLKYLEN